MATENIQLRCHTISHDILDELAARFIINIPMEERKDLVRVCFQLEQAHWFYIDFYVDEKQTGKLKLQGGTIKEFAAHMFAHVPFLQPHVNRVEEIIDEWKEYKLAVPTFGAIIMNTFLDKVLLVQGFWAKASWGFPKGKVNEDEPPHLCAAREVMEETGYDIMDRLDESDYLEQVVNDQTVRLYVITGVAENTKFKTNTRCEIRDIKWFEVNSLPTNKLDQNSRAKLGVSANNFFMVIPFLSDIKLWINNKQRDQREFLNEVDTGRTRRNSHREKEWGRPGDRTPGLVGEGQRPRRNSERLKISGAGNPNQSVKKPLAKQASGTKAVESQQRKTHTGEQGRSRDKISPAKSVGQPKLVKKKLIYTESGPKPEIPDNQPKHQEPKSVRKLSKSAAKKLTDNLSHQQHEQQNHQLLQLGITPNHHGHTGQHTKPLMQSTPNQVMTPSQFSSPGQSTTMNRKMTPNQNIIFNPDAIQQQTPMQNMSFSKLINISTPNQNINSGQNNTRNHRQGPVKQVTPIENLSTSKHLISDGFCPNAWRNFRLDHDELLRLSLG